MVDTGRESNFLLAMTFGAVVLGFAFCLGAPADAAESSTSSPPPGLPQAIRQADAYYQQRENPDNLRKAVAILEQYVASEPRDYEAWWRIAEYDCYLGRRLPDTQEKPVVEQGITAGKRAENLRPNSPEGHFWTGVDEGLLANVRGLLGGLALIGPVKNEMQAVLRLDPDYWQDGAERVLGRLYYRLPFFKGGNDQRSIQLLEHCLKQYPDNSLTMLYLADSYRAAKRLDDARSLLKEILRLSPAPGNKPDLTQDQAEARKELKKYFHASA